MSRPLGIACAESRTLLTVSTHRDAANVSGREAGRAGLVLDTTSRH
jgi:hypothetical protein